MVLSQFMLEQLDRSLLLQDQILLQLKLSLEMVLSDLHDVHILLQFDQLSGI